MQPLRRLAWWQYCGVHAAELNALPAPRKSRASRRRAALALAVSVLAAHLLLLGRAPLRPGAEARAEAVRSLSVRQIVVPAPAAVPAAAAAAAGPRAVPQPAAAAPKPRAAARRADARIDPDPAPGAGRDAQAAAPAAATPSAAADGGVDLPAYATRLPPAVTLRYSLLRGGASGQAELRWRPAEGRYTLTLDSGGGGLPRLGSASEGGLDATGIAPERYTESRRGRDQRAVNFQAASGRITFSQPSLQHDWLPGAQDRLSWMLQLPAVLEAEPALRETGSELRLYVAGTRGDAEVWAFDVLGRETLETPAGAVPGALHLRRLPRRPYDVQVDVWLDPARHHLPVRLRLLLQPAGSGTELSLEQHSTP
jgi:Protein of unknown function (DUF3108)